MEDRENKKNKKKLTKLVNMTVTKCQKNKCVKIPGSDINLIVNLTESIKDNSELMYLYKTCKKYIPDELIPRIEALLGIKKEQVEKKESIKDFSNPTIIKNNNIVYKQEDNISYITKTYDELPEKTKEMLELYKQKGYLFEVAKQHKSFDNDSDRMILENIDARNGDSIRVYWANESELKIIINHNSEVLTVLEALDKYKDNKDFLMHLNYLLGLSLYTPSSAYFDEDVLIRKRQM